MKNEKYYVGLDIGTDSVGYAVTNESYKLCKFKGEPMWGVTLFDVAQGANERRNYRSARRRLDRRQQRVSLVAELFEEEIAKTDEGFFKRIKESYLYPETAEDKVRLFDTYENQKSYMTRYPTIHHLIVELMNSDEPHDARLVYLACSWLVSHRGHFLNEVDKSNIDEVTNFENVYKKLTDFICRGGEYALAWSEGTDPNDVANVLKKKLGVTKKTKELTKLLFGDKKAPKVVNEEYEFNYELVIKLLCGGKAGLKELFGKEEYSELEEKSVALNMDDERLAAIMQTIGDDAALISALKAVYDWSILVDILNGKSTISEAKCATYEQHRSDLKILKYFTKKYLPERYKEIFRAENVKDNYVAYIGKNKTSGKSVKAEKSTNKESFCKYILSLFKSVKTEDEDLENYNDMISRLEIGDFMPKQVESDNRVIPYQLYWFEMNKILKNAENYLPFLSEADEEGITGTDKVLSIFEFRVPYYVGPLKEKSNSKYNHWMVRKAEGKIYPWNFEEKVDLDESENAFISRMTSFCTYLSGENVLPKCSIIYSSFEVLNEINNIKINGNDIPVNVKQEIYENVFMLYQKVTPKRIKDYLVSNNHMCSDDTISGLDASVKSSLKPYLQFKRLIATGLIDNSDAENIISRATYSEDKARFAKWLKREFSHLPESEIKYISGLKFKDFGRLSKRFLCEIEGVNKETGELYPSIMRAMWETNCNLMQILSDKFTFSENVDAFVKEYYDLNPKSVSDRLDEMYISNSVKRPIIRSLDILKDIVKVQGNVPKRIFIEMARGENETKKGKRTNTRLEQIYRRYEKVKDEDVKILIKQLEELGEDAHSSLQSDKLFLYFIQFGKCLYTGKSIDIDSVIRGDGAYNIEHIYPRSFVKDDSVINNKILVDSKANGDKNDTYPIDPSIQRKMHPEWERLNKLGLMSDEKYKRLIRTTPFTADEKFEFINRQLVETRQSTKALATLLKEIYPESEIVYVKAGLVSDFRQKFELPKSRAVNDLHHAKDAYLNIVVGNVWHCKFSRQFWQAREKNNAKVEVVFTHPVKCGNETVWNGAEDKEKAVKIAKKNTAHMTMYSYCKHSGQNGGFFDQNPLPAAKGLIPLKKDRPTEIYGGYDSATISGFILVKYREGRKQQLSLVPLKLLHMAKFEADDSYAAEYIKNELGEKATEIEILLNKRIIKIFATISLDGALYCIRGKGGKTNIGIMNMMPFMTSPETELYIKRLERFNEKHKANESFIWSEKYDGITVKKNVELFGIYIEKLSSWPYNTRPGNEVFVAKLKKNTDKFENLDIFEQAYVLLQIQGIFGRIKQADLGYLGESANSCIASLSLNLSNWKKNYKDVRIIDRSASGLFEKASENLLELL